MAFKLNLKLENEFREWERALSDYDSKHPNKEKPKYPRWTSAEKVLRHGGTLKPARTQAT